MSRRTLYPTSTWLFWVCALPLALVALGVAVAMTVDVGTLVLDSPDLWWLGFAIPVAGLIYLYGAIRRRGALNRFTSARLAPLLARRISPPRQAIRAGLIVLAALLIVVAVLGPRWGIYLEKHKVHGVDIVVALDVSRSMLTEDVAPNRLERAKRRIIEQLTERAAFTRSHRLALLAFAGSTTLRLPLTTDHLAFRTKLEMLEVGAAPRGGTAIAEAIRRAVDLCARSPEQATKIILLLTDGEDHEGGPVEAAEVAWKEHGIHVFTVGVGDPGRTVGTPVPGREHGSRKPLLHDGQIVFSKVDVASLRQIAEAGAGRYVPLEDLHQLVGAIAGMRRAELTTEERMRRKPRYQWLLALALILLGLETIMSELRPTDKQALQRIWQQEAVT